MTFLLLKFPQGSDALSHFTLDSTKGSRDSLCPRDIIQLYPLPLPLAVLKENLSSLVLTFYKITFFSSLNFKVGFIIPPPTIKYAGYSKFG